MRQAYDYWQDQPDRYTTACIWPLTGCRGHRPNAPQVRSFPLSISLELASFPIHASRPRPCHGWVRRPRPAYGPSDSQHAAGSPRPGDRLLGTTIRCHTNVPFSSDHSWSPVPTTNPRGFSSAASPGVRPGQCGLFLSADYCCGPEGLEPYPSPARHTDTCSTPFGHVRNRVTTARPSP